MLLSIYYMPKVLITKGSEDNIDLRSLSYLKVYLKKLYHSLYHSLTGVSRNRPLTQLVVVSLDIVWFYKLSISYFKTFFDDFL